VNFWRYLSSRHQQLLTDTYQHASVVFQCMVVATLIGVVIGVVTYHGDWAGGVATTTTSTIVPAAQGREAAEDLVAEAGAGGVRRDRRDAHQHLRGDPERYPAIAQVLDPITKKLDNDVAQTLNSKVEVDGQDPHQVALDWRKQEGFVKGG
jgi:hypothetical protein